MTGLPFSVLSMCDPFKIGLVLLSTYIRTWWLALPKVFWSGKSLLLQYLPKSLLSQYLQNAAVGGVSHSDIGLVWSVSHTVWHDMCCG